MILEQIADLTKRIKENIRVINGKLYLNAYLLDEFFHFVNDNWRELGSPAVINTYLPLQKLVVDDFLLKIVVNNTSNNLYNSMMTYNASCTEEDLHRYLNLPYGGDGEIEHECTHTGAGNGVSDFKTQGVIQLDIKNPIVPGVGFVVVGPEIEAKDYDGLESAKDHFKKEAKTTKYHDAKHVIIHLIDTNTYYIAANRADSRWYELANMENIKHYRKQVKLWINDDGILGVKFREYKN